jgi:hypothetical protein
MQPLDNATIINGLKEALRVGTQNAVRLTSSEDGFLGNELIRIALPDQLETLVKVLRTVGFESQVQELEVTMNRAAERGAGEATDVFVDAIAKMSFGDARAILDGNETAATDYFRDKTSGTLTKRFKPLVKEKMQEVGLVQQYESLVDRFTAIPLMSAPVLSLEDYVTDKTLDGLFTVLADEERRIRTDPSARVTELLQRVFGS